ncbi:MAG: metallophosphoesterase [Oscillospiraceae bacterium]|nr:metallophosphoesterase [Oscillospiraceae bacterium]
MKLLHSADWHLDAPLTLHAPQNRAYLRQELLRLPEKVAQAARQELCDLMVLSGDLFDGAYTKESFSAVYRALAEVGIPVCIAPGNHDFYSPTSPYFQEIWPENVHIFTKNTMESISFPHLDCRVWGAAYTAPCCDPLLADFQAEGSERWAIGVLHGDPMQANSPYCPVSAYQLRRSGLDYLALGHIHKTGTAQSGGGFCGWPGCPMGKGYDECGEKGVLIVTLSDSVHSRFLPLDTPRFYDLEAAVTGSPVQTLEKLLPAAQSTDFYRVALTGEWESVDIGALKRQFSRCPNLSITDKTVPPVDLWAAAGTDTLEGLYFSLLRQQLDAGYDRNTVQLAAKLSRQLLDGQEVAL